MNNKLIFITVGRATQMVLMFATYRVLSSLFSVEDMGGYYFLLSIAGAYGLILANPIGMYTNRKIHEWQNDGSLKEHLTKLIASYGIGSLLTIPFLFLFKDKLANIHLSLLPVMAILIFYVFSSTINTTFIPLLNLLGDAVHFVVWTFITSVLGLCVSYYLVKHMALDPMYWLLGQAIVLFIFGMVGFVLILKKFPGHQNSISNESIGKVVKFAIPIAVTNIFVWSMSQSFRFFLKDNINPTTLGEIVFGMGMATSLSVAVEYLFQQLLLPDFYRDLNSEHQSKEVVWNKMFNRIVPAYLIVAFYLFGLAPFIMRILADQKFKNAEVFLGIGAFVEFFRMLSNLFNMAMHADMKTEKSLVPYFLGGTITLVSVLFISKNPTYTFLIPYTLGAGYFVSCIFLAFNVRKIFSIIADWKKLSQYFLCSLLFLLPLMIKKNIAISFVNSVLICFVFGVLLLLLLFKQYQNDHRRSGGTDAR